MRYDVIISKSGSITIPVAIRNELGIKPGQTVRQAMKGNKIILDFDTETKKVAKAELREKK